MDKNQDWPQIKVFKDLDLEKGFIKNSTNFFGSYLSLTEEEIGSLRQEWLVKKEDKGSLTLELQLFYRSGTVWYLGQIFSGSKSGEIYLKAIGKKVITVANHPRLSRWFAINENGFQLPLEKTEERFKVDSFRVFFSS